VKGTNSVGNDDNVNNGTNNFVTLGYSRNYRQTIQGNALDTLVHKQKKPE
jgi:hypothetical protein